MLSKPKLQFSLRTILLITFIVAPVTVYVTQIRRRAATPDLHLHVFQDGSAEIDGQRRPYTEIIPLLVEEVSRRQHFKNGAALYLHYSDPPKNACRDLIAAAIEAGKIDAIYPEGRMFLNLSVTPPDLPVDSPMLQNNGMGGAGLSGMGIMHEQSPKPTTQTRK